MNLILQKTRILELSFVILTLYQHVTDRQASWLSLLQCAI